MHGFKVYMNSLLKLGCSNFFSEKNKICQLPKLTGDCKAGKLRFYFDSNAGECVQFLYGGCDGNKNNFLTRKECEIECKR